MGDSDSQTAIQAIEQSLKELAVEDLAAKSPVERVQRATAEVRRCKERVDKLQEQKVSLEKKVQEWQRLLEENATMHTTAQTSYTDALAAQTRAATDVANLQKPTSVHDTSKLDAVFQGVSEQQLKDLDMSQDKLDQIRATISGNIAKATPCPMEEEPESSPAAALKRPADDPKPETLLTEFLQTMGLGVVNEETYKLDDLAENFQEFQTKKRAKTSSADTSG